MIYQIETEEQEFESKPVTLMVTDDFYTAWLSVQAALEMHAGKSYDVTVSIWQSGKIESSYYYETFDGRMHWNSGSKLWEAMVKTAEQFKKHASKTSGEI